MLSNESIDRELERYRKHLLDAVDRMQLQISGARGWADIARQQMEDLIFLVDEVPDDRRAEVEYLIDRFEALVKSGAN